MQEEQRKKEEEERIKREEEKKKLEEEKAKEKVRNEWPSSKDKNVGGVLLGIPYCSGECEKFVLVIAKELWCTCCQFLNSRWPGGTVKHRYQRNNRVTQLASRQEMLQGR